MLMVLYTHHTKLFRTWTLEWWEVGLIKVSLISLGILAGKYFGAVLFPLEWVLWPAFAIPSTYFIIRFFRDT